MSDRYFLFRWDDVPGIDNGQLISHLEKCLGTTWARNAEIKKDSTNKIITVTDGKNSLTLKIENVVVLDLGKGETFKYDMKREYGKLTIYNKEAAFILRELGPEDDEELQKLGSAVSERSLKEPRAMVKALHSADEEDFLKAATVLLSMEDVALRPLLEALSPDVPERRVWDMQAIVDLQLKNRVRIAKALESMLDDKRPIPPPETPPSVEEKPIPRRVCDEAYMMLRKLLAFEETEEEQFFNADSFLNKSDVERDAEIRRARTSKRWTPLAQQFSETEE
jgi:hypothetical protein